MGLLSKISEKYRDQLRLDIMRNLQEFLDEIIEGCVIYDLNYMFYIKVKTSQNVISVIKPEKPTHLSIMSSVLNGVKLLMENYRTSWGLYSIKNQLERNIEVYNRTKDIKDLYHTIKKYEREHVW